MLYKFINETTIQAQPSVIKHNGKIYVNPKDDDLKAMGFKELREGQAPEYDEESQYIIKKFAEYNDFIQAEYEAVNIDI